MLRLLRDAGPSGLATADWNAKARDIGIGVNRRTTLVNLKGQLKDKGLVREYNDIWQVPEVASALRVATPIERRNVT